MNQEESGNRKILAYRLEQAKETLRDAHLLLDRDGSPGSVINRSYYAMYYAVQALLAWLGKGSSKHTGVISMFDEDFVKSGEFPKLMSKALHKAFDLRQMGDYRELIDLDQEQAKEILRSADRFVETVVKYLANK